MRESDIFKYLKHWKVALIFALVFALLVGYYFKSNQVVTTSVKITYHNPDAEEGYFPDGKKLDTQEVYSADVISRIIDDLNLGSADQPMSTETIRNLITIEAIIPEDKQALIEGASTHGEEYIYHPVEYRVILKDSVGMFSKSGSIKIVSKLVDVYVEKFIKDHVTRSVIPAIPVNTSYDYLDRVEILNNSVRSMLTFLTEMASVDASFRSHTTGYCFDDLNDLYNECRSDDINLLYAQILGEKVTKDIDVLMNNYKNRITNRGLDSEDKNVELKKLKLLLDSYVEKAKEQNSIGNLISGDGSNPNTQTSNSSEDSYYFGNGYVLQDVYERNRRGQFDYTTTYDEAIAKYAEFLKEIYDLDTDVDYCNYVLSVFEKYDKDQYSQSVDSSFTALDEKLDRLYQNVKATVADYDAVMAAKSVTASGIIQSEEYNLKLYIAIGAFSGLIVGLLFLIVFGRMRDIFRVYKAQEGAPDEDASTGEQKDEITDPDTDPDTDLSESSG